LEELSNRSGDIILGGDMRAGSLGHGAKYGSYPALELQSNRAGKITNAIICSILSREMICAQPTTFGLFCACFYLFWLYAHIIDAIKSNKAYFMMSENVYAMQCLCCEVMHE
jgi:hypothetical protein